MSEPIPESVPTSADPRSKRPLKRRALTPTSAQANQVEALFAKPDIDIPLPSTNGTVAKKSTLAPPPEIVANVQGSSAGAGSGEFHVYKASRRREYERIKQMTEQVAKEKADEDGQEDEGGEELKKKLGPVKLPMDESGGNEEEAVVKSVEAVGVVIHDD
ncbi:MAG: hypothetical protein Q9171_004032 [Xanthocarpia ochracea]